MNGEKFDVKKEALRRIENLPQNWYNIKRILRKIVEHGYAEYLRDYLPRGRAGMYIVKYNKIWDYGKSEWTEGNWNEDYRRLSDFFYGKESLC